jgi:hypothetical protein
MEFVSPGVSKAAVGSATNECFCSLQGVRAGIHQINHKTEAYGIFIGIAASVQQFSEGISSRTVSLYLSGLARLS